MFIDRAKIITKAGNGGNGMSSFRHEKFVPNGGPNGGDGGRGGNVILLTDENLNTLLDFRYRNKFVAENGVNGQTCNMHGKNAPKLFVKVPFGTLVRDGETEEIVAELTMAGQEVVLARGGKGGRGNARFASSTHRAPTFAEKGEPGQERTFLLELKLLADVGLVGYPSVGKSSIISLVSAAKSKIAAYFFTTLTPVLGVVNINEKNSFVLADIPGLIKDAHKGKGLGFEFLRHIEHTKVLIHVLDMSNLQGRDPIEDFKQINNELELYDKFLINRPQIIAANKMDLEESQKNYQRVAEYMSRNNYEIIPVSAVTGDGIWKLMQKAANAAALYTPKIEKNNKTKIYEAKITEQFRIVRSIDGAFVITGYGIEKLVAMTNFDNDEGVRRFQFILKKTGIENVLRDKGIKDGEIVRIGKMDFEYKK